MFVNWYRLTIFVFFLCFLWYVGWNASRWIFVLAVAQFFFLKFLSLTIKLKWYMQLHFCTVLPFYNKHDDFSLLWKSFLLKCVLFCIKLLKWLKNNVPWPRCYYLGIKTYPINLVFMAWLLANVHFWLDLSYTWTSKKKSN